MSKALLLIDEDRDHGEQLGRVLSERGFIVTRAADCGEAIATLRNRKTTCDLVILSMAGRTQPWLAVLRALQEAGGRAGSLELPRFLCASRQQLGVDMQLQIERMGARYVSEE